LFVAGPFTTFSVRFSQSLKLNLENSFVYLQVNKRKKVLKFVSQEISTSFFKKFAKILTSCHSGFKRYLHVRGDIYDFQVIGDSSANVNVGFSYIVNYNFVQHIVTSLPRKRVLRTQSKFLSTLATSLAQVQNLRPTDPYRGLGIYKRYEKIIYKKRRKQKSSK